MFTISRPVLAYSLLADTVFRSRYKDLRCYTNCGITSKTIPTIADWVCDGAPELLMVT